MPLNDQKLNLLKTSGTIVFSILVAVACSKKDNRELISVIGKGGQQKTSDQSKNSNATGNFNESKDKSSSNENTDEGIKIGPASAEQKALDVASAEVTNTYIDEIIAQYRGSLGSSPILFEDLKANYKLTQILSQIRKIEDSDYRLLLVHHLNESKEGSKIGPDDRKDFMYSGVLQESDTASAQLLIPFVLSESKLGPELADYHHYEFSLAKKLGSYQEIGNAQDVFSKLIDAEVIDGIYHIKVDANSTEDITITLREVSKNQVSITIDIPSNDLYKSFVLLYTKNK